MVSVAGLPFDAGGRFAGAEGIVLAIGTSSAAGAAGKAGGLLAAVARRAASSEALRLGFITLWHHDILIL
jgi:hypothetical protein